MQTATRMAEASLKWPLIGAGTLVVATLAMTGFARLDAPAGDIAQTIRQPAQQPITARLLRFDDRADGGVDVLDARTGRRVYLIQPNEDGFLRGVLRALSRDRIQRGLDSGPAFSLVQRADTSLWIEDTATGRVIALNAFGTTNSSAFMRLMSQREFKP